MINTIQMQDSWFSQSLRGFAGYTNATDHEYFFDDDVDFEETFGEGADLSEYLLELSDGRRLRLYQVISATQVELHGPALELNLTGQSWRIRHMDDPPDALWAEITYLDNRPTIESNFGRLINFTLDDLAERTDNLDYLSAVQGLWYYVWGSRTLFRTRVGSQIILGLPFAEEKGNIIDIQSPFDATRDRILIQDEDNPSIVRSYMFPTGLSIEENPETGVAYSLGDTVEQFSPLCEGVTITDYIDDPEWISPYLGSGDLHEPHKVHTFGVIVDASIFDLTNILFLSAYLRQYQPTYKDPFLVVLKTMEQSINVGDSMLLGPAVPPSGYTYPEDWPDYEVQPTWASSPHETTRSGSPTVPENLGIPFGGLRLADVPGKAPDGWEGAWPSGASGTHSATISEGSFRYDDTDESGHCIHRYDAHLLATNLISDGDWESGDDPGDPASAWDLVGSPSTASASVAEVHGGTYSLLINDLSTAGVGVSQEIDGTGNHPGPTAIDESFQVGARIWVYLVSGQAHFRLYDQDNPQTVLAEWRHATRHGQWHKIHLHSWEVSAQDTNYLKLEILTGPAGGHFYVDDIGIYEKVMPWTQWGYDRAIAGRTGGYTQGGLPDEKTTFQMAMTLPAQIPRYDSGFYYDAASAPDAGELSGPTVDTPPADWTSPGISNTPWTPSDAGYPVSEWTAANGYTGYGALGRPTRSWRYDVSLPAGWYVRATTGKKHSGQQ